MQLSNEQLENLVVKLVSLNHGWTVDFDEDDLTALHEAEQKADEWYRPRPHGCIDYDKRGFSPSGFVSIKELREDG